jgi:hypothetical protein
MLDNADVVILDTVPTGEVAPPTESAHLFEVPALPLLDIITVMRFAVDGTETLNSVSVLFNVGVVSRSPYCMESNLANATAS